MKQGTGDKGIFLLGILVFGLVFFGAGCNSPQAQIDSPMLGSKDAPLQIVEYFDFQCPACKIYENAIMHFVVEDYVNTGKASLTYKNMAFIGKESVLAANASLCAAEAGKYEEYHAKLLEKQLGENQGTFIKSFLKDIGEELGIDIKQCVASGKYNEQIDEELQEAYSLGIDGTPAIFINGVLIRNPSSYLAMKTLLDEEYDKIKK